MQESIYSITLAAGSSSRMPEDMRPKACCKIGAKSVIDNCLTTYESAGISNHVLVVGHAAETVMDEVTRKRSNVLFAYQGEQRGTGDAVACALDLLDGIGAPDHVVISAGDKIIAPYVVRGLIETYSASDCDFCLAAGPRESYPDSGRIITRDGLVQGILEVPDISARQMAEALRTMNDQARPATVADLAAFAAGYFPKITKLRKCMPALAEILGQPEEESLDWPRVLAAVEGLGNSFELPCGTIPVEEAAGVPLANIFVYVAAFEPLRNAIKQLGTGNVQGERYLTDVAQIMAGEGREVRLFRIGHPEHVMSFNTLPQLEEVRQVHAIQSLDQSHRVTLGEWDNYLRAQDGSDLLSKAVSALAKETSPDRPAILVRSPGRINLMGRHIDHQGGTCNLMAIDREITMAAAPRDDDRINIWNTDAENYPMRSFTIDELTHDVDWENWINTLDTQFIRRTVSMSAGDWGNYVKGAALRLQHRFRDRKLRGMDAYISGNIPVAAGLSSSSALLVATAEALIELNALNIRMSEFVDLCGEGEWFVGTRGGSADHAAIKHGRESQIVSVSFFPFRILSHHPFPAGHSLIVCHSGQSAKKTENARERFNARVACYHMAREVIKKQFPQFAPRIHQLRDVNTQNLDISLPALYGIIKSLPNELAPGEAEAMAAMHPTVEKCLAGIDASHNDFPLRDMTLFGLGECARSARAGAILDQDNLALFGNMMGISHNGDRVATWRPDRVAYDSSVPDGRIDELIAKSTSFAPLAKNNVALWQQPGAYDCSTPEIDLMVDTAVDCPGVIGAQLSGAGLGGCIMIVARDDAVEEVRKRLTDTYYTPHDIEPRIFVCRASRGSHTITSVDG
jgi:N-acetylgalactosamine kinase